MKNRYLYIMLLMLLFLNASVIKAQGIRCPEFMDCFLSLKLDGTEIVDSTKYELLAISSNDNISIGRIIDIENSRYWTIRIYGGTETFKCSLKLIDKKNQDEYTLCNYDIFYRPYSFIGNICNTPTVSFSSSQIIEGDLNFDGKISCADISILIEQILHKSDLISTISDINNDGSTTSSDLSILIQRIFYP